MTRRNKDSSTITLKFSDTFELQDGDLEIDVEISARVFIQKPKPYADSDWDYYGYTEVVCSSCQVKEARSFDELIQDFVLIDWIEFLKNYNKKLHSGLESEIEDKVAKAIDRQLLKVI